MTRSILFVILVFAIGGPPISAEDSPREWRNFAFIDSGESNISNSGGFTVGDQRQRARLTGTFQLGVDLDGQTYLRYVDVETVDSQWFSPETDHPFAGPLADGAKLVDLLYNDIRELHGTKIEAGGQLTLEFTEAENSDGEVDPPDVVVLPLGFSTELAFKFDAGFFDSQQVTVNGSSSAVFIADLPFVAINQAVAVPLLLGDFDQNGVRDSLDIDALSKQLLSGEFRGIYDVDFDQNLNQTDRRWWVNELKNTWFGDANLDGEFNSQDLVEVFQAGQYEDDIPGNSGWATGDWNGDQEFDSADFVTAFADGGFERGRKMISNVPEPGGWSLVVPWIGLLQWRRVSLGFN